MVEKALCTSLAPKDKLHYNHKHFSEHQDVPVHFWGQGW